MLSTINGVEISCISAVLPKNEETIYKRLSPYLSEKKIKRLENNIGFSNFATTIQGQTAGDLCFCAAEKLIKQTKIARDSIDAIIFLSQMPDYISPPTSFILQSKLKLSNNVIAIDVNHGCPGYVYGLYLASCLISGGNCKRVLLCWVILNLKWFIQVILVLVQFLGMRVQQH